MQETFVRAIENWPRIGRGLLTASDRMQRAYLFRIAHNLKIDWWRRRGRIRQVHLDSVPEIPDRTMEDRVETQEERDKLLHLIKNLQPNYAQVLAPRYVEGYHREAISGIMNASYSQVNNWLHRAEAALRKRAAKVAS